MGLLGLLGFLLNEMGLLGFFLNEMGCSDFEIFLFGSIRKSSVGACKSFCMNFDSFKIVDSGLP